MVGAEAVEVVSGGEDAVVFAHPERTGLGCEVAATPERFSTGGYA